MKVSVMLGHTHATVLSDLYILISLLHKSIIVSRHFTELQIVVTYDRDTVSLWATMNARKKKVQFH